MEFFKFIPDTSSTVLEKGQIINGLTSAMWVERYSDVGEFQFESPLSIQLQNFLPLGTLISHVETPEVMIVESHELKETNNNESVVVTSGRSFVSYLENRAVGMHLARVGNYAYPYVAEVDYSWQQIINLISDHINVDYGFGDGLSNVYATFDIPIFVDGEQIQRTIPRKSVWEAVKDLLAIDNLGIRSIRPLYNGSTLASLQTIIQVYRRESNAPKVVFSWNAGDLESVDYLFTNKNSKNSALVSGTYVTAIVDLGPANYEKRVAAIDGSDIDSYLGAMPPAGPEFDSIYNMMVARAYQTLYAKQEIAITQADISPNTKHKYRRDYALGDLVLLDGNFGEMARMMVVEHAEIEDENGESSHPTLADPNLPEISG